MKLLYNPERTKYSKHGGDNCPLCHAMQLPEDKVQEHLIVKRSTIGVIMMNAYPYNPGHLLVVPYQHAATLSDMAPHDQLELCALMLQARDLLKQRLHGTDLNIGINEGKSSGGSIQNHVHIHVVPRFVGDTNFLAVTAETKVVTKDIITMYKILTK